jgi:hypothetical protein
MALGVCREDGSQLFRGRFGRHRSDRHDGEQTDEFHFVRVFFFGGRPRLSLPTGTSQFGCLQFGQCAGLPSIRLIQVCSQRRHSQIISGGIDI